MGRVALLYHFYRLLLPCTIVAHVNTSDNLDLEERAGCFALFVFLVFRNCCVALPNDATGLSAFCDCGIS